MTSLLRTTIPFSMRELPRNYTKLLLLRWLVETPIADDDPNSITTKSVIDLF